MPLVGNIFLRAARAFGYACVAGAWALGILSAAQAQDESKPDDPFVRNVSNKGTVAAAFLEIGIGARAEAMGGAYTAQAGSAEMIYWNPAGLAYVDGLAVSLSHTEWLAETNFEFFSVAAPLPFANAVAAASFTSLAVPQQPVRTVAEPEGTGENYSAQDFAVNVSVAARLISSFSVGLSGKYISQRIWTESASQFALDVGVYYQTPLRGLVLGSSISNFGPDLRMQGRHLTNVLDPDPVNRGIENVPVGYETDSFSLPQIFRFGVSYMLSLPMRNHIVMGVDLMHPTGSTEGINVGMEYGLLDILFLRVGYQSLYEREAVNGLALGAGLQYVLRSRSRFAFDYAYSNWGILQKVHRVSLGIYL